MGVVSWELESCRHVPLFGGLGFRNGPDLGLRGSVFFWLWVSSVEFRLWGLKVVRVFRLC